jgi:hypothetical protein
MAGSAVSQITLSELCFPDITGKVIRFWGEVDFTPGTYTTGGLTMGLLALSDGLTIDFNGFLRCKVLGENVVTPTTGGYSYHYSPVGDVLQIFSPTGVELANGAAIPSQVLTDDIIFMASWNRTTVLG